MNDQQAVTGDVSGMGTEAPKVTVDVSGMSTEALLKVLELEWQDHIQCRQQTWQALQNTSILTVALVGIQWTSTHPLVGVLSSLLLIGVSVLGMQVTFRHRNSVETTKFSIIVAIEVKLGLKSTGLKAPNPIGIGDVFRLSKSNTSLFLLRMQAIIHVIGWMMLAFSIERWMR